MTTIVENPSTIFVHVPKAGGTSIKDWLARYANGSNKKGKYGKHCEFYKIPVKADFSFGVIRNPWDRLVSSWSYELRVAKSRLHHIETNSRKVKPHKQGWTYEWNKERLDRLEKGFEHYVKFGDYGPAQVLQVDFLKGVDYIIRLENIEEDFKVIQQRFNCFEPLPSKNTSSHKSYRDYYTTEIKAIVDKYYAKDIAEYGYEF
jgi:hypothetical protein